MVWGAITIVIVGILIFTGAKQEKVVPVPEPTDLSVTPPETGRVNCSEVKNFYAPECNNSTDAKK